MALNTTINRNSLIEIFPDLNTDSNFKILSNKDNTYNCIAWAMGYTDRWIDPFPLVGHWWPDNTTKDLSPESLIEAFESEHFELTDDCSFEEDYEKVVLYKKGNQWTHAAKIVACGIEHSKFGSLWDGQHSHNVLCNTGRRHVSQSYGIAYAYMKRKKDMHQPTKLQYGTITIDVDKLAKLKALLK